MEQLLRGQEIPEINPYDNTQPVVFFPVRHHSPACSYHLKQAIEEIRPECILIEGPQNAQSQIPVLGHKDTKAPLALYYFYKDTRGLLSQEKEDYKCYYPYLDCSPELVALRAASDRGIPARFIDLSYGEILLHTAGDHGIRKGTEKQSYNDDYLLSRSRYLALLCEKAGLRSFEEFWEKYFEIRGLRLETPDFVKEMLTYCYLSRIHIPREELEADGCLWRERFMAGEIKKASEEYGKILVVTGGFHTYGLLEELKSPHLVKLHNLGEKEQGVYPLAYSMEAADALNGYASGMPSPGFYQRVWEHIVETGTVEEAYQETVLNQLVQTGRQARRKKESLSSYDEICAFSMARGLAALRGKWEPGLYELQDAALSSFVKGECSLSTDLPLRILGELNTGKQVGKLCGDALRPPLLMDFEEQCQKFGFQVQAASEKELVLEIFTKNKHMAMSRFLYQMEFLGTGFGKRRKGADLLNRRDRSRIREIWSYRFSSQVLAALVDASTLGGTVREAARTRLLHQFGKSQSSREAARLLVQGFLMGFLSEQASMGEHAHKVLLTDGDFFSLTEGFSHLRMLYELQELYHVKAVKELEELLHICFQKVVQLLPSMAQVPDERLKDCMESCLNLYQITGVKQFSHLRAVLMEAFSRLLEKPGIQPGLDGAVLGLLYGYDNACSARIRETAGGYLEGSGEMRMKSASFLRGLFYTARDFVFVREDFLELIDVLLLKLSPEEFLSLLPELRMAFSYFTPLETDRIAGKAAALHGVNARQLLKGRKVSPLEYQYGEMLDAYGLKEMQN